MTGSATLLRAFLRRDRWLYVWWGLGATLLYYSQAVSVKGLYTTQAEFDKAATSMAGNTAFIAMAGPARALNTIGGQVMWQASAFGAVVAGLMSMFLVGRHTRAEEESGRDELVRAAAVSRHAPLTAALADALLANLVLGTLVAVSLVSFPLPAADSIAVGVGLTLCGWVFSATALVAAQLTSSTRSMYGVAGSVIAVAYALRAIGDVGNPALSWLSPIGWYQGMHPYSGLRWWPALLLLTLAVAAAVTAYLLFGVRDFGTGLWAARPGPDRADAVLSSPLGFAWRLQRGSVIGWAGWDGAARARLRLDRGRRRHPDRRLDRVPGRVRPGWGQSRRRLLRRGHRDDRPGGCGLHGVVGPASAGRGGRGKGRGAAGDRADPPPLADGAGRRDDRRAPWRSWSGEGSVWALGYALVTGDGGADCSVPASTRSGTPHRPWCSPASRGCCTAWCRAGRSWPGWGSGSAS